MSLVSQASSSTLKHWTAATLPSLLQNSPRVQLKVAVCLGSPAGHTALTKPMPSLPSEHLSSYVARMIKTRILISSNMCRSALPPASPMHAHHRPSTRPAFCIRKAIAQLGRGQCGLARTFRWSGRSEGGQRLFWTAHRVRIPRHRHILA